MGHSGEGKTCNCSSGFEEDEDPWGRVFQAQGIISGKATE